MNNNIEIIDLFVGNKGFIHKNLKLKKNKKKGFYFIANESISEGTTLIKAPYDLLIPVDKLKSLKDTQNKFKSLYLKIVSENSNYLDIHPLKSTKLEFNIITNTLKNNQNLSKNFILKYEKFNLLNDEEKLIHLLSMTRAVFLKSHKKKYFMPVVDFLNYSDSGANLQQDDNSNIFIVSNKNIKKNEEIFINYTNTDSITFFLNHGFITNNFNSFKIKKNELKLRFNNKTVFNEKFFLKVENHIEFIEDIHFIKNQISRNLIDFMDIFPSNEKIPSMKKILNYYKNSIIIENKDTNSVIIKNFYKSVELYFNIIDNYSELLSKKYEKN